MRNNDLYVSRDFVLGFLAACKYGDQLREAADYPEVYEAAVHAVCEESLCRYPVLRDACYDADGIAYVPMLELSRILDGTGSEIGELWETYLRDEGVTRRREELQAPQ